MKLTITIEGDFAPDALAKFLRSATPACEAPAPAKNRRSASDKLRELQSLHDQQDAYTVREINPLRGNGSQTLPEWNGSTDEPSHES